MICIGGSWKGIQAVDVFAVLSVSSWLLAAISRLVYRILGRTAGHLSVCRPSLLLVILLTVHVPFCCRAGAVVAGAGDDLQQQPRQERGYDEGDAYAGRSQARLSVAETLQAERSEI